MKAFCWPLLLGGSISSYVLDCPFSFLNEHLTYESIFQNDHNSQQQCDIFPHYFNKHTSRVTDPTDPFSTGIK